uniref:Uncharacterized protein n=1 Tax=viral metagenome TaxID=1070528 RepID=A0A6C0HTN3_9ZZZZ
MPCKFISATGEKCTKSALYNLKGSSPEYCSLHKTEEMVDVYSIRCEHKNEKGDSCNKTVSYGYRDTKKKVRCAEHKLDGMIDLKHPPCQEPNCSNTRSYGFPNEKAATYCSEHKKDGMINVKHKKCEKCSQIPSYNYNGETRAKFCKEHKLENMVDVTHKRCEYNGCIHRPLYNIKGEKPRFCNHHKTNEMIDVLNKRCKYIDCYKFPSYNYPIESKPLYCSEHKLKDMIFVLGTKCINEWCEERYYINKYDNYCFRCFVNLFPDKPNSRNYKTKEKAVCDFIFETFNNMTWITDKQVLDGCSRRRPDLLLDLGYQVIIIEVDENQHNDYDSTCENKRLMELSKDVGHRNIIFIRFNPDDYKNINNEKIKSCWSINKTNTILIVNTKDRKQWNMRLETLKNKVEYWINNKTDKMVEIIQLFYDEC